MARIQSRLVHQWSNTRGTKRRLVIEGHDVRYSRFYVERCDVDSLGGERWMHEKRIVRSDEVGDEDGYDYELCMAIVGLAAASGGK